MELTKKQRQLLIVINNYRSKYGRVLTLREMAKAAKISDVKSVFRMIQTLIQKGFLYKNNKAKGVLLTDLALIKLGLLIAKEKFDRPISSVKNYKKETNFVNKLSESPSLYVSNSTPNEIAYGGKSLKFTGTSVNIDIDSVVKSVANIVMSKQKINEVLQYFSPFLPKGSTLNFISLIFGLLLSETFAFFIFKNLTENNILISFIFSIFSLVIIVLLIRKGDL